MPRPLNLSTGISPFARYGAGHYGARALSGLGDDGIPVVTTTVTYDESADEYPGTTYQANPSTTLPAGTTMGPTPISVTGQIANFLQGSSLQNYGALLLVGGGLVLFAVMSGRRR
jgi:hypothetical protein